MLIDDISELLKSKYPVIAMSAAALEKKYGDYYKTEADIVLRSIKAVCDGLSLDLEDEIGRYQAYVNGLIAMHKQYLKTFEYPAANPVFAAQGPCEGRMLRYNLALMFSIVFFIHRFEMYSYFREMFGKYAPKGGACLEIGTGAGLDAGYMSDSSVVDTYDVNPCSKEYLDLLGAKENVRFHAEKYDFGKSEKYDFISMVELLEHVDDPVSYLTGARGALKPNGRAFFTFAVRMPQEDHIFHYKNISEAKAQVAEAGLRVIEDFTAVSSMFPFDESQRASMADNPRVPVNYCCVASAAAGG